MDNFARNLCKISLLTGISSACHQVLGNCSPHCGNDETESEQKRKY